MYANVRQWFYKIPRPFRLLGAGVFLALVLVVVLMYGLGSVQPSMASAPVVIALDSGFTTYSVTVDIPSGQALNLGAIPIEIVVTADGTTPEITVVITSANTAYQGRTMVPQGSSTNLPGWQEFVFPAGVGSDGKATLEVLHVPPAAGVYSFQVLVEMAGQEIYDAIYTTYVTEVSPNFTDWDVVVDVPSGQPLNEGAIPVSVTVSADGTTPPLVVSVESTGTVYLDNSMVPQGSSVNLPGWQQFSFPGGVGGDNRVTLLVHHTPPSTGVYPFRVIVTMAGYAIYDAIHTTYVTEVTSSFTDYDVVVSASSGQLLNEGAIAIDVGVLADGPTPPFSVVVTSTATSYLGYTMMPAGQLQNLFVQLPSYLSAPCKMYCVNVLTC